MEVSAQKANPTNSGSTVPNIPGYELEKSLNTKMFASAAKSLKAIAVTQSENFLVVFQYSNGESIRIYRLPSFELLIEKQVSYSPSYEYTFFSKDELLVYLPNKTCGTSYPKCTFTKLNVISGLTEYSHMESKEFEGKIAIVSKGIEPMYIKNESYLLLGGEDAQVYVFKKKGETLDYPVEKITQKKEPSPRNVINNVDVNIPINSQNKSSTYALVIGNEDYSSYQQGLRKEADVPYARNDAKVFKEYLVRTIGVPERQIKLIEDGTYGQINQGLAWLNQLAMIEGGQAELILYYSGHGLPDVNSGESFIIPVDVSGFNLKQAISLDGVITSLAKSPTQRTLVFLDACFSGGGRKESLLLDKGIKIKPREVKTAGNLWLFASSSGEESSGVYEEGKHGYFTYFLLKKLKESKGNLTLDDLRKDVTRNVGKENSAFPGHCKRHLYGSVLRLRICGLLG